MASSMPARRRSRTDLASPPKAFGADPPSRSYTKPPFTRIVWDVRQENTRRLDLQPDYATAESNVIVEVEVIKPRFHIFANLADAADLLGEKLQRFDIAIWSALVMVGAPLLDFPRRAFAGSVLLNPREYFAVTFSVASSAFNASAVKPVNRNQ